MDSIKTVLLQVSSFIISFASLFLIFFVIYPLMRLHSYKKAGVSTYFYPILGFFQYLKKSFEKYGDTMGIIREDARKSPDEKYQVINIGFDNMINLRDIGYVRDFLQKQNLYKKTKYIDMFRLIAGTGLVTAEGDVWKRHRKIVSNSFHYEFLKTNVQMIQETTREFLGSLKTEDLQNFNVMRKIQEITGEIVGRIFFGRHLNGYVFEGKPLTLALADIMTEIAVLRRTAPALFFGAAVVRIPFFPRYRALLKRINAFRQVCSNIIHDRKTSCSEKNHDLLASLLETQYSEEPESRYSDEDIINEFVTFFIAGMDTTARLIGMALYQLTQHPEYLEQLEKERSEIYKSQKVTSVEGLNKMDILNCFLKETLRLYTPAPTSFIRRSQEDHYLKDLLVKKGELVRADLCFLFNNPKYFSEPEKFSIERWQDDSLKKLGPHVFIPFSAGPRNCIGQHLAMMEAKIIISEFLEMFKLKNSQENYQLKMILNLLYEPQHDIIFTLTPVI